MRAVRIPFFVAGKCGGGRRVKDAAPYEPAVMQSAAKHPLHRHTKAARSVHERALEQSGGKSGASRMPRPTNLLSCRAQRSIPFTGTQKRRDPCMNGFWSNPVRRAARQGCRALRTCCHTERSEASPSQTHKSGAIGSRWLWSNPVRRAARQGCRTLRTCCHAERSEASPSQTHKSGVIGNRWFWRIR